MYLSSCCIVGPGWGGGRGRMDEWEGGGKGKWGLLERLAGLDGGLLEQGSALSAPPTLLLFTMQCKRLWVEATHLDVHSSTPLHSTSGCIVGASARVGRGHYTNRRGDTLGASPETWDRETGMKNWIRCTQNKASRKFSFCQMNW